jgi:hypothetical protein
MIYSGRKRHQTEEATLEPRVNQSADLDAKFPRGPSVFRVGNDTLTLMQKIHAARFPQLFFAFKEFKFGNAS